MTENRLMHSLKIECTGLPNTTIFESHTTLLNHTEAGSDSMILDCTRAFALTAHSRSYLFTLDRCLPSPYRRIKALPLDEQDHSPCIHDRLTIITVKHVISPAQKQTS